MFYLPFIVYILTIAPFVDCKGIYSQEELFKSAIIRKASVGDLLNATDHNGNLLIDTISYAYPFLYRKNDQQRFDDFMNDFESMVLFSNKTYPYKTMLNAAYKLKLFLKVNPNVHYILMDQQFGKWGEFDSLFEVATQIADNQMKFIFDANANGSFDLIDKIHADDYLFEDAKHYAGFTDSIIELMYDQISIYNYKMVKLFSILDNFITSNYNIKTSLMEIEVKEPINMNMIYDVTKNYYRISIIENALKQNSLSFVVTKINSCLKQQANLFAPNKTFVADEFSSLLNQLLQYKASSASESIASIIQEYEKFNSRYPDAKLSTCVISSKLGSFEDIKTTYTFAVVQNIWKYKQVYDINQNKTQVCSNIFKSLLEDNNATSTLLENTKKIWEQWTMSEKNTWKNACVNIQKRIITNNNLSDDIKLEKIASTINDYTTYYKTRFSKINSIPIESFGSVEDFFKCFN
uniref:ERAP1_C domain-containing protein n=1 Tax=Rhabditophanes sp. KR3021 TaxID=114890 RepID=A0AC35U8S9_9BILA